jgi:hypothetical protein
MKKIAGSISVPKDNPLEPYMPQDAFMAASWSTCVQWALGHTPTLDRFTAATGINPPRPRTGIERMVDTACGYDGNLEFLKAFLPWFNENVWGTEEIQVGQETAK